MTDIILNLPDDPAMPESAEPAAVAGDPSDDELLTLDQLRNSWNVQADAANSWDELGADEIVLWAQKQALNRWGQQAWPQPAAVVPPTRRQLMMLASDMGMTSIDEAVKFALVALARWGCPAHALPIPAEGE